MIGRARRVHVVRLHDLFEQPRARVAREGVDDLSNGKSESVQRQRLTEANGRPYLASHLQKHHHKNAAARSGRISDSRDSDSRSIYGLNSETYAVLPDLMGVLG